MNMITEEQVKNAINKILVNESAKVKRDEFNRLQFKIEELQNSLNETIKEFRKLEESVPDPLKPITNGRITGISQNLTNAQKLIGQLKVKIKTYKRNLYLQQIEERKNK